MTPQKSKIKVAVVEDVAEARERLSKLLNAAEEFDCVATCDSAEEALRTLPGRPPDVILLDLGLPGLSGIDCIPQLKEKLPAAQILVLTIFDDHDRIFRALAAGAKGYLLKKSNAEDLLKAIRELHAGGAPMSSPIARRVVDAFERPHPAASAMANLSLREREVLNLLTQGLLYKEIADRLQISLGTVRGHISGIYEKLHVHTRTEAVLKVLSGQH